MCLVKEEVKTKIDLLIKAISENTKTLKAFIKLVKEQDSSSE